MAADSKDFFPLDGMNLAVFGVPMDTKIFGDLKAERNSLKRIAIVPTQLLIDVRISEKTVVQAVFIDDWNEQNEPEQFRNKTESVLLNYKMGKSFHAYLKPKENILPGDNHPESSEPLYNHFTIFLGDLKFAEKLATDPLKRTYFLPSEDTVSGIAYIGNERKMRASKRNILSYKLLPKDDLIYKKIYDHPLKTDEWIKVASLYQHKILIIKKILVEEPKKREREKAAGRPLDEYSAYLMSKTGENELIGYSQDGFEALTNLAYYDWFTDGKAMLISDDEGDGWPKCTKLFIVSEQKVEKVRLPCRRDVFLEKTKNK